MAYALEGAPENVTVAGTEANICIVILIIETAAQDMVVIIMKAPTWVGTLCQGQF